MTYKLYIYYAVNTTCNRCNILCYQFEDYFLNNNYLLICSLVIRQHRLLNQNRYNNAFVNGLYKNMWYTTNETFEIYVWTLLLCDHAVYAIWIISGLQYCFAANQIKQTTSELCPILWVYIRFLPICAFHWYMFFTFIVKRYEYNYIQFYR